MASDFDLENALLAEHGYNPCQNAYDAAQRRRDQVAYEATKYQDSHRSREQAAPEVWIRREHEEALLRQQLADARRAREHAEMAQALRLLREQGRQLTAFMNVPRMPRQEPIYDSVPAAAPAAAPAARILEGPTSPVDVDSDPDPIGELKLKPVRGVVVDD